MRLKAIIRTVLLVISLLALASTAPLLGQDSLSKSDSAAKPPVKVATGHAFVTGPVTQEQYADLVENNIRVRDKMHLQALNIACRGIMNATNRMLSKPELKTCKETADYIRHLAVKECPEKHVGLGRIVDGHLDLTDWERDLRKGEMCLFDNNENRYMFSLTCGNSITTTLPGEKASTPPGTDVRPPFVPTADTTTKDSVKTKVPAPTVSLFADELTLKKGAGTTIRWRTLNAAECVGYKGWSGEKHTGFGSEFTGPLKNVGTRSYTLTCWNSAGVEKSDWLTLYVEGGPSHWKRNTAIGVGVAGLLACPVYMLAHHQDWCFRNVNITKVHPPK